MPLMAQAPTSRIILGLMTMGPETSDGARITSQSEYGKILDVFQSRGYNEVDTARVYVGGKQEAFTREAGWKDRGLTLATKIKYPNEQGANAKEKVLESAELSFKELGADCIDLLYLHAADRGTPFASTLSAIDELHRAGKFVRLGISNFTAFEVAEIVMLCTRNGWVRPTVYQGMYNALTRAIEPELIPACRRYGLDIVVYNPIAGGLFSGKIRSVEDVPTEGRFSNAGGVQGQRYRDRYYRESTFKALEVIRKAVARHESLTMVEVGLRWVVNHSKLKVKDGNDGVLIGVSRLEQLEENLTNLEKGPLPEDVVQALDEAWALVKGEVGPYWHLDLEYGYDTQEALFGANTE